MTTPKSYKFETPEEAYLDNGNMKEIKQWLLDHVTPEHIFIDVGAHIGCMFIPVVDKTGPWRAVAIEPTPESFDFLKKNCEANLLEDRMKNVLLVNAAAADHSGKGFMYNCGFGSPSNTMRDRFEGKFTPQIPVDLLALNDLGLPQMGRIIMKIDAELSEPQIWKGMKELLPRIDGIVLEFFANGYKEAGIDVQPFIDEVRADGFKIRSVLNGKEMSDRDLLSSGKIDVVLTKE